MGTEEAGTEEARGEGEMIVWTVAGTLGHADASATLRPRPTRNETPLLVPWREVDGYPRVLPDSDLFLR